MAMMNTAALDPRIGMLGNGRFYAFAHGYGQPETIGSLVEVEAALGIRVAAPVRKAQKTANWNVTMRFACPAWDEVDGIVFAGIQADCKSDAVKQTRKQADSDGHTSRGRGRYWFTAVLAD